MRERALLPALLCAALAAACGSSLSEGDGTTAASIDVPRTITDDDYAEWERRYWSLALSDPARAGLRERLLAYLARRTPALVEADDYPAVVGHFARMSELHTPEDYGEGRVGRELGPVARYIHRKGSARGDEGRVLSALVVLRALEEDRRWAREYRTLVRWGRDARASLESPVERYGRLIMVWQEHARLTPSPEVLELLARMHLEQRDAILARLPGEGDSPLAAGRISLADARQGLVLVRRAPLDVAGVFLQHGDIASALTHVEAMGEVSGIEGQLIRTLRDARDGDDDALIELASAYLEGRPDVTLGVCRLGHRRSPADAQYPLCLARVASVGGDFAKATGWYAEAIRLAPETRDMYDEALERLAQFIARGLFEADPSQSRGMARAAERILDERMRRWSDSDPAVTREQLHYVVGLLEMNAGNMTEARRQLEASLELAENAAVHLQLGRIAESTSRPADATRHYRRALDMTPADDEGGSLARAQLMEHLGDAFRASDERAQANRMYRQALDLWEAAVVSTPPEQMADIHLHRGVLADLLGRREDAMTAFRQAMSASTGRRDVYAQILSHLVAAEPAAPQMAREVFQRAQNQLTLEPEWKVYFALWLDAIEARAGEERDPQVTEILGLHSRSQAWWGRLAKFGLGELPFEELLSEASNRGQRAEALFYEGTRLLRAGDPAGARDKFRQVLQTEMVNFYEFMMSLELLLEPRDRAHAQSTTANAPAR